jgi:hypothetical protein
MKKLSAAGRKKQLTAQLSGGRTTIGSYIEEICTRVS